MGQSFPLSKGLLSKEDALSSSGEPKSCLLEITGEVDQHSWEQMWF